ncbi:MAG: hypothetical protein BZY82_03395 [SAR202 cluster bacterium Io17-Chloro-G3]|nr:MAG: hypothetical protein BZY82_03395 [SAR202 cluster bacterium Io17-Chloro-G3]
MAVRFLIIFLSMVIVVLAVVLGVVLVGGGQGGASLQARAIQVDIVEGKITQGSLEAKSGEIVTLRVTTDEPWMIHLHGIEVADKVEPGHVLLLPFEASKEGRFEIELHPVETHGHAGHGDHKRADSSGGYVNILP